MLRVIGCWNRETQEYHNYVTTLHPDQFSAEELAALYSLRWIVELMMKLLKSACHLDHLDTGNENSLRTFIYALNALVTVGMVILLLPPVFDLIVRDLMGVPSEVAVLTHQSLLLLLPWPAAIGYRRFYQGLLIRDNLTRRVAYGTVVRMVSVTISALVLVALTDLPGASIGALALSIAVVLESAVRTE